MNRAEQAPAFSLDDLPVELGVEGWSTDKRESFYDMAQALGNLDFKLFYRGGEGYDEAREQSPVDTFYADVRGPEIIGTRVSPDNGNLTHVAVSVNPGKQNAKHWPYNWRIMSEHGPDDAKETPSYTNHDNNRPEVRGMLADLLAKADFNSELRQSFLDVEGYRAWFEAHETAVEPLLPR